MLTETFLPLILLLFRSIHRSARNPTLSTCLVSKASIHRAALICALKPSNIDDLTNVQGGDSLCDFPQTQTLEMASAGALGPLDATNELLENGLHHLTEPTQLIFLKNVCGGLLFSFAGLFALIAAAGCPGLGESNPGLTRLLQGATFPVGLVIIYLIGAELHTGYPMWLTITALQRKGKAIQYAKSLVVSWVGNFIGALLSSTVFSYSTKVLHEEPYRSGVITQVTNDIVDAQWHVIFLKAVGCGFLVSSLFYASMRPLPIPSLSRIRRKELLSRAYLYQVTLAMFLGTQNHDGISKAIGLHLPFFMSTTARYPHTVEYMYLTSIGMMLGAPLSVGGFIWKCLLPITLGNSVGGAVFVSAYNWWVYLHCEDGKASREDGFVSLNGTEST